MPRAGAASTGGRKPRRGRPRSRSWSRPRTRTRARPPRGRLSAGPSLSTRITTMDACSVLAAENSRAEAWPASCLTARHGSFSVDTPLTLLIRWLERGLHVTPGFGRLWLIKGMALCMNRSPQAPSRTHVRLSARPRATDMATGPAGDTESQPCTPRAPGCLRRELGLENEPFLLQQLHLPVREPQNCSRCGFQGAQGTACGCE